MKTKELRECRRQARLPPPEIIQLLQFLQLTSASPYELQQFNTSSNRYVASELSRLL
jgi:hypothetical protein